MTNYHLLSQTKLAKMADEYLTCTVRGKIFNSTNSSCLVQIISTNPFEISDSSHHIRVRDPSSILTALKRVNSNINLLSMKGALISLQKWNFESYYVPGKNEIKFDIIIEEVEYIDGIGTSELVMDTTPISDVPSLKNKFKRLKKFLMAKNFDSFHPIDSTFELLEAENFKNSEKIKTCEYPSQKGIENTFENRNDPFFIWRHDQYTTKSSVSKSQISQISQMSDFEVLSINSAVQGKCGILRLKSFDQNKQIQPSLPTNPFALDFSLLSSEPIVQKMQIDQNVELEDNFPKIFNQVNEIEIENSQEINELDQSRERSECVQDNPSSPESEIIQKNTKFNEYNNHNLVEEEQNLPNKLKRNFHEMVKNGASTNVEVPHYDLKKLKYQWGPNHKNAQQEFRKTLIGKKSLDLVAPNADILDLLASSQLLLPQDQKDPSKIRKNNDAIIVDGTEMEEEVLEESPLLENKRINRHYNLQSDQETLEVPNVVPSRRTSTPTLGPKKKEHKNNYFLTSEGVQAKNFRVNEPQGNNSLKLREVVRPWSFGRPQEQIDFSKENFMTYNNSGQSWGEERKKEQSHIMEKERRKENKYKNGKENIKDQKKQFTMIDLTKERSEYLIQEKVSSKGVDHKKLFSLKANDNIYKLIQETPPDRIKRESKKNPTKTVANPLDPTKTIDMSEFKDISVQLKKNRPNTNSNKVNSLQRKSNEIIEIM